jgi:dynein heavy chain, axonemal
MALIQALGNQHMKEYHWIEIFQLLKVEFFEGFTLQFLLDKNVTKMLIEIEEISNKASGEALIEKQLNIIVQKWVELNFTIVSYGED